MMTSRFCARVISRRGSSASNLHLFASSGLDTEGGLYSIRIYTYRIRREDRIVQKGERGEPSSTHQQDDPK